MFEIIPQLVNRLVDNNIIVISIAIIYKFV